MDDLYKDNSEVAWCSVMVMGIPTLVVQTEGPVLSGKFLGNEYKALRLRCLMEPLDENGELSFKPTTFVCLEGQNILNPVLACDPCPTLQPLLDAEKEKLPWILALQFMVEGQPHTRLLVTNDGVTAPLGGPDRNGVLSHWICGMV